MLSEKSESVSVIDHETEVVFLLEGCDLVENTERTCHTVNTLGNEENTAAVGISLSACTCKNLLAIFNIVVTILVLAADMQTDTVEQTCVALGVINDHIVTCGKSVNGRNDSLISEVVEISIFLLLELSEHLFKLLVVSGVA